MTRRDEIDVNADNLWRLEARPPSGWAHSPYAEAPDKYFMVSVDAHMSPPPALFKERIDARYRDRLPAIRVENGKKYLVQEGLSPARIYEPPMEGEDVLRNRAGGHVLHQFLEHGIDNSATGLARIDDQRLDGVDAEVIFPNGPALLMWGAADPGFIQAQCAIWNDWAMEVCGPHLDRCNPVGAVQTADIDVAIAEVERCAAMGFRALTLPNKPIWGPHRVEHANYNLPEYDPLWQVISDCDLAVTFHVSTGMDPRTARGNGGAVISYVVHSLSPTIEPIVNLSAAGVFERFPRLRAGTIEANAGWLPFVLDSMDEAYRKHHFWVRPKLDGLPSDYFRSNCFASVGEDRPALLLAEEYDLTHNLMWANDYPHHEGSWPHSAEAILRTFENAPLGEDARARVLGLNAARVFRFDVPQRYRAAPGDAALN